MKTKIRLFLFLFGIMNCIQCYAVYHSYDFTKDGLYYLFDQYESSKVAVTHGDNKYAGKITIPSKVVWNGTTYRVSKIAPHAFSGCNELTAINFGDVEDIGADAFENCTALTELDLRNVRFIDRWAFSGCENLKMVRMQKIRCIGEKSFAGLNRLENVIISHLSDEFGSPMPYEIKNGAFESCENLKHISLLHADKIEDYAFSGCSSLHNLILLDTQQLGPYSLPEVLQSLICRTDQYYNLPILIPNTDNPDPNGISWQPSLAYTSYQGGSAPNQIPVYFRPAPYVNMHCNPAIMFLQPGDINQVDCYSDDKLICSDNSVVDVRQGGRIKALKPGICYITCVHSSGCKAACTVVVGSQKYTPVEDVFIEESTITIESGYQKEVHGSVYPHDASCPTPVYMSLDTDIATVDEHGVITAHHPGQTLIVAVSPNNSYQMASCYLNVEYNENQLSRDIIHCKTGDRGQLTVEGSRETYDSWKSSDNSIVSIDAKGRYEAHKKGVCRIRVNVSSREYYSYCTFVVDDAPFVPSQSVCINEDKVHLDYKHTTHQLVATVNPSGQVTYGDVQWKVQDNDIASVSADGLVTALHPGVTKVFAESTDGLVLRDTCTIFVDKNMLPSFQMKPQKVYCKSWDTGVITPAPVLSSPLTWTSTDPQIVKSTGQGGYEGNNSGVAQLVATDDKGLSAYTTICVDYRFSPDIKFVDWVRLNVNQLQMDPGERNSLSADVFPTDATFKNVQWWSDAASVVSVDDHGNLTALRDGIAHVYALSTDGYAVADECTVRVGQVEESLSFDVHELTMGIFDQKVLHVLYNGNTLESSLVSWKTDNARVVTANTKGELIPKGAGTTIITAEYEVAPGVKLAATCQVTVDEVLLKDNEIYAEPVEKYVRTVYYDRNFVNRNWQALYLPFPLAYEEWSSDFDIAEIYNMHQYDDNNDGLIDRTLLEVIYLPEGMDTEANTPYLIRAKSTGQKRLKTSDVLLADKIDCSIDCSSTKASYTFTGTYDGVDGPTMYGNKYYALAGGGLKLANHPDAGLRGYRWFMAVRDRNQHVLPSLQSIGLRVIRNGEVVEDTETGLDLVKDDVLQTPFDIYDLNGRKIRSNVMHTDDLPHGVYIINGKKFIK